MTPELRARIERLAGELWTAAQQPENRNDHNARQRWIAWAAGTVDAAIEEEVERRLSAREGKGT